MLLIKKYRLLIMLVSCDYICRNHDNQEQVYHTCTYHHIVLVVDYILFLAKTVYHQRNAIKWSELTTHKQTDLKLTLLAFIYIYMY